MREILVINPRKKRKKRKVKSMPKRRRRRKAAPKRRARRNPRGRAKRTARAVGKRLMSGLSLRKSMTNMLWIQVGMFASKWASKRWGGTNPATETDPGSWNYLSYIKGGAGGVLAAMLCNAIKPGSGQKVLDGAMSLMMYKILQNEVIVNSPAAVDLFGSDDAYTPDEYLLTGNDEWFMGSDGNYYPTGEQYRLPETTMGDSLRPVDQLGSALVPVTELGAARSTKDAYRQAYFKSI